MCFCYKVALVYKLSYKLGIYVLLLCSRDNKMHSFFAPLSLPRICIISGKTMVVPKKRLFETASAAMLNLYFFQISGFFRESFELWMIRTLKHHHCNMMFCSEGHRCFPIQNHLKLKHQTKLTSNCFREMVYD